MRGVVAKTVLPLAAVVVLANQAAAQFQPAKPGPEHEKLKQLEGTWEAAVKMPGLPDSKGTMVYKMDVGGLWLVGDYQGTFGGMAFKGKGLDSYDAASKKYVSVWVDSMSTVPMISRGEFDPTGKVLTMTGESQGPDGKVVKMKSVTEMKDRDTMVFTMSGPGPDGKEGTMMTIHYKRTK